MTCLEYLFTDIDTIIDCEIDCIGCKKTDCPDDRRKERRGSMKEDSVVEKKISEASKEELKAELERREEEELSEEISLNEEV